ncbi:MAG: CopG family transcriptional regulator [Candidatus Ratteibacteria bacterium]|nr:CopG family transcriptional regulator [Candidatus Ratteibacteria bacterium]
MAETSKKSVQIEIPSTLAERLEKQAQKAGYSNLSDYITHLLRKGCSSNNNDSSCLNPEEEKKIEERLKDLGYID